MSAPTPAPGDDRPREGYYPDPSIPGYVRYWNGAAWVPGTSRPAPRAGEPLAPPPGAQPAGQAPGAVQPQAGHGPGGQPSEGYHGARPVQPAVEETGPHFFDEDPQPQQDPQPEIRQWGAGQEPASAWGADRARQSGFGGEQDRRVSWGADPRVPAEPAPAPNGPSGSTEGTASIPPADPGDLVPDGTFVFRRPTPGPAATRPPASAQPQGPTPPPADEGTITFRAVRPRPGNQPGGAPAERDTGQGADAGAPPAAGIGVQGPVGRQGGPGAAQGAAGAVPAAAAPGFGAPTAPADPARPGPSGPGPSGPDAARPGFGAGKAAADRAAAQVAQAPALPGPQQTPGRQPVPGPPSAPGQQSVPGQHSVPGQQPASGPLTSGPGGGQASWAQQVHQLAGGEEQPVAPWKPPVEDVFQAAARRRASARPAGLGKRLTARLIDTVLLAAVTGAAAVPLGVRAAEHVQDKIDEARLSGRTVTVWLLDGTTGASLGIVLGVLVVFGILYEVLPTARWGRTLGKKLCGLEVRDIEAHEAPAFGQALRRWLVQTLPALLVVGVLGLAWCLFDRPWRQCWHDKAAHTFVSG